jgi:hypothetical protein
MDEDFEDLFAFRQGDGPIICLDNADLISSEDPCCDRGMNSGEESDEEDGEGESLYEKVQFGRNGVEMSFLAYNKEWKDAYGTSEQVYSAIKLVVSSFYPQSTFPRGWLECSIAPIHILGLCASAPRPNAKVPVSMTWSKS